MSGVNISAVEAEINKLTTKRDLLQAEINSLKDTLIRPKLRQLLEDSRRAGNVDIIADLTDLLSNGKTRWPKDATRNLLRKHDIPFRLDEEGEHDTLRGYSVTKCDMYLATFT